MDARGAVPTLELGCPTLGLLEILVIYNSVLQLSLSKCISRIIELHALSL